MALMFPRLARNFAKNGYYPTDEPTLERALNALMPSDGPMCILDPCAGECAAIAELAHDMGRERVRAPGPFSRSSYEGSANAYSSEP